MPRAAGLAAELKQALSVESELIAGRGGVFEITVDGKKLFSKKALGRFPEDGEVLGLIRAH
jgi:selenoprotein W-related protein